MKHIVILYSGGLDSRTMYHYALTKYADAKIECLFFDYGQPYADKEIKALLPNVEVRKVDWMGENDQPVGKLGSKSKSGNIFIPGRNLAMAVLAACIKLPDEIWLGACLGETHAESTDKNETFLEKSNDTLNYVLSPFKEHIKVRFPIVDEGWGKLDAIRWAFENGLSADVLTSTCSCLNDSKEKNCGYCVTCVRRFHIFNQLGIAEEYEQNPLTTMPEMYLEMLKGEESHYDKYRRDEIIPSLRMIFKTEDNKQIEQKVNEMMNN
jgi:7-cyano-7-deazaguanine synthase in queuosine biosynthesis